MGSGEYDIAQVCSNGHVVNDSYNHKPEDRANFCGKCGQPTIVACASCEERIRGRHRWGYASSFSRVSRFCHACGDQYPWTTAALDAAKQLARETEHLSTEDRELLESSIDDLIRDTPTTPLSANRFKRLMQKAGKAAAEEFRALLVDVLSEAAKKSIYP